jgi:hypothetical protein
MRPKIGRKKNDDETDKKPMMKPIKNPWWNRKKTMMKLKIQRKLMRKPK